MYSEMDEKVNSTFVAVVLVFAFAEPGTELYRDDWRDQFHLIANRG